jgi:uncharacterized protein
MTDLLDRRWRSAALSGPDVRADYPLGMASITDELIAEAARRLTDAAPADAQIILFGSAARGQAGLHSDLDFLVIEAEVADWGEESFRLRETLDSLRIAADIVVVSRDDVERWRDVYGTVVHAALSEGKVMHG